MSALPGVTIGPRPAGVAPDAEPVALHVGGTWQVVWVHNPDDFVVSLHDLGYIVTSALGQSTPELAAPESVPFRLHLVR